MFSLISKLVDYFIKDENEPGFTSHQSEILSDTSTTKNDSQALSTFFHSHTHGLHGLPDVPHFVTSKENIKRRALQGKVTHVFHGHGLIDGDVYFSLSDLYGAKNVQTGDTVHVNAVQHSEDGGWYAEEISIVDQTWDAPAQQESQNIDLSLLQNEVVLGKVTWFSNGLGKIDKEISFEIDDCKDGYVPKRGDWVAANVEEQSVENDDEDEWGTRDPTILRKARNICPSRQRNLEGVISAVMTDHGYIDGEIFFDRNACLNGYKPRKNEVVKVLAIESVQGKCEWRAVSIFPLSSESDAYRSKQFKQPVKQANGTWLVPGQRPKGFAPKVTLPVKLPHYTVPDKLEMSVMEGDELTEVSPVLMQELSFRNYANRMSTLLHLEEIQMQMDIREFDMPRVCLKHAGELLALTVPGLAEGRPSVLIGDKIILSSPSDPDGPSYEGFVHELTATDVHLKFTSEFHCRYNGEDYNVEFTFSRTPLRRCHQAVSLAVQYLGSAVLFPLQVDLKPPQVKLEDIMPSEDSVILPGINSDANANNINKHNSGTTRQQEQQQHSPENTQNNSSPSLYSSQDVRSRISLSPPANSNSFQTRNTKVVTSPSPALSPSDMRKPVNRYNINTSRRKRQGLQYFNTGLNERQKAAVMKILLGQARPMPYVIFGPPGTGKTITVVETILQVLTQVPSSRILACTPSNSAADLIAERLHQSGAIEQTQMVRLNAFQRAVDNIPECILKYCRFAEDLPMISRYRVIVSTCTMAGALYGLGLSAGHITHVFVDECGQATEPECLIPVGLLSGTDGQIVLAGDPKQLGPIIMSPFAKMYGLELSFLERLMMREPYHRDETSYPEHGGFDSALVTMLVNNYRSHPSILELPSRLFYYNQLQPFADPQLTHTLAKWTMLPTSGFPVVFHGIRGEDIREANSPSWFNPGETIQVVRYLQGVLKEGVDPDDVGVITPYRKQVEKIRLMMDRLGIPDVKVGSVEEFQGQERQVIIISTVRSNEKLIGFDIRHTLGFLSNPKRFNVSITRAQALLILVGNPYVLAQDPSWRLLIQYCADNGGYVGCDLPDFTAYESECDL